MEKNGKEFKKRFIDTRLKIVKSAAKQSLEQVIKTAIDEVCKVAKSPIGFYHLINEDQETLAMLTWSSELLKAGSKTETKHYSISDASLWLDCVKDRKTVVNNDSNSEEKGNGFPGGQVKVIREMVVPVVRSGKVMAILGVGNKETAYTEQDIEILNYLADVTWTVIDQKRTEEALIRSELKYRSLVDNSPSGIMIIGADFKIEYVNKEIGRILKCKEEDVIGTNFINLVSEEDRPLLAERYQQRREGKPVPTRYEFRALAFDGEKRHIELTSSIIAAVAGDTKTVAQVIDITERRTAEKALSESEERYRTLVENSPDGITLSDLEGNLITSNQAVLDMHGYDTVEDLIASESNVFNFVVEEERAVAYENAAKVLEKGAINDIPYTLLRKDGTTFPGELSAALIKDEEGNPTGFVALTRDISERTEYEQKLEETSERLSNIFRAANDGMWDWTLETGHVFYDPRYYEMAGYEVDEFPHRLEEFQDRVHPDDLDPVMKTANDHLEGKTERFIVEFRFRRKDNSWMWIMGRGIIVERDEQGNPLRLMGTHTDISVNKDLLSDLQIEKEKAEESDRLKSAFLANMSHEIRTPMNGILGFTDLLYNEDLSHDQQKEYLQIIKRSGERMLNTINDIIDISKIESGQAELSLSEVNLNDQLDYLYEFFLPEARKKGLKLLVHKTYNDKDLVIKADKEKLLATISNLLKNAIKYSNEGSIEFGYDIEGDYLKFYVSDTGIGISEDRQLAIFDRFVQADLSITKAYEGSGLGLAISKGFVDIMGGKIWVESQLDKGSKFFFTIPYLSAMTIQQMEDSRGLKTGDTRFSHLTVMIAEDDESAYFYLHELLRKHCKAIVRAHNGTEAVELCRENSDINMVLMDIKMPDMDGYAATREIRKFNKDIPIIGQTAYAMVGDSQKVLEAGCNDYISKPIDRSEMYEVMLRWV